MSNRASVLHHASRHPAPLLAGLILASLATSGSHAQGVQVRNLALSGQQAPGAAPGVNFSTFNALSINAGGRVAMNATLAGPGVTATNRDTIWWDVPGVMQLVARTSEPAPGQPTFNYTSLGGSAPNLSDSGIMTYGALIAPPATGSRDSVWTVSPASPPAAFAVGLTPAPGLEPGAQWNGFSSPQINGNGAMAFRAIIASSAGSNNTHWIGTPNTLTLVSRDTFPTGVLPGVNFAGVLNEYRINSAGTFVFRSSLTGAGVTASNNQALWHRSPAGALSLVARTGDQAPGLAAGALISSIIGDPELDGSGRVAFRATLAGTGISSPNNQAIFIHDSGTTTLLVQRGDQAPGVPAGVVWNGSFEVTPGGQGTLVLKAALTGPGVTSANGSGIWKRTGTGPFTLIARAGAPAPGTSPVQNFASFTVNTANIATNSLGRIMLAAPLTTSAEGIWLEDAAGALHLAVLEGTPFDVNDDPNITTLKTVNALSFPPAAGDDDGRRNAYGDAGEVAFQLTFVDATAGAFFAGLPQDCDNIDFNNDGLFPDTADIDEFLSVFSGGPCSTAPAPGCNDIDFNNDGLFPDTADIDSLLSVFSGGPCL